MAEFEASAISPELALANTRWVDGPQAVEEFLEASLASRQRVQSYITAGNARLIERYQFLEAGGWIAYGESLDGTPGPVPYMKPAQPRWDAERGRWVKYETPPGMAARPILPVLPRLSWAEVLASDSPIAFIEGFKKSLSTVEQGCPAAAIRGATQWHPKGSSELWPELAELARGRVILIPLDADEGAKTRATVSRQAQLLGNAIERAGGVPRFILWPAALGKGLDDVLAMLPPEHRRGWLQDAIERALTPQQFRRLATIETARAILITSGPQAQRETTGEYLPQLPPLTPGAIHWIDAGMGSGKTYRQGLDWVRPWAEAGGITVVLSPLNSLGQQTARDWGLPHIHDYGTDPDSQQALQADISHRGGLVACLNSAHRVLTLIPQNAPVLLILDEAAQTLTDAVEGGTLGGDWAARWEDVIALMQRAATGGAIALAEAGIDLATIELVQAQSGAAQIIGIRHRRAATPWPVQMHRATPLSGWRAELTQALEAGQRVLYVTTSQKEGRRLECWAVEAGISAARVDSTTNEGGRYREFFETPEAWLYANLPQLLILSPSGKTGLSIEGEISVAGAYFDSVWGYFPSLDTDTAMQLLGRYRPPVPRHIWAPAYITPAPGEGPKLWGIERELSTEAARYAQHGGFELAPADSHDKALKTYLAARRQRRWAQKIQAAEALGDALRAAGHRVEVIDTGANSKAMTARWDEIKKQLAREDAAYHAALEIDPDTHTWEWANTVIRSTDSTYEQRCKAAKVRTAARFPGLDWNCQALWYDAEFCPRRDVSAKAPSCGPLAPGAALWVEAGHYSALWAENTAEAQRVLSQRLKAAHLLPQSGPRAMLAAIFRRDVEALLAAGHVTPSGAVEARIKATALRHRAELRRYWRLSIDEAQSDTAIANKIARKFGLILERARRVTVAGQRQWIYSITASDTWRAMVSARELALRGDGTNLLEGTYNEFVPPLPPGAEQHAACGVASSPPPQDLPPDRGERQAS
ncbi:DUF3854 domain-containing protein [Leptolyngbya sp. CCNP1308]|uniref:DUF3854 domain-containing protein n=1 Tax=Leptolyngbya sp. CCNP1308 TaxID=3110255 RepID=UPI002B1FACAE|nr:DUF3854 domain-containing protein [Leptolyngbya sp. CCNP1308]MEA5448506.1 DUF3854 domain-containing protein [Leptolyngbya sp. CCNP1308]